VTTSALASVGFQLGSRAYAAAPGEAWDPSKPFISQAKAVRIQPLLMYATPQRREQTSWKSWGGVQTEQAAEEEAGRIDTELAALAKTAEFPIEVLPVIKARTPEEAEKAHLTEQDVLLLYPATGSGNLLRSCFSKKVPTVLFIRHRSGPVYYWYEALSTEYLKTKTPSTPEEGSPLDPTLEDVVVDDPAELLWRLRGICGARNLKGTRVLALGGAWGKYAPEAPQAAKDRFGMEIIDIPYSDIEGRITAMIQDKAFMSECEGWTKQYLELPGTQLETKPEFVRNSFALYRLFKELMQEHECPAFTIRSCMGTIMPMGQTTACLALQILNDEGLVALCESDFVVIPAGILLRHIASRPVFMHNSTFPHQGMVTCAHCTSPRRLDGTRYEPARIVTHYESEYGAAPKVEMPKGQVVTILDPEYASGRWLGFTGAVESNPFYDICRSQQDVLIRGDWKKLIPEVRDSHWMMVYGDYLKEAGYAAKKLGLRWEEIAAA
jgi:hypothetical protein